MDRTRGLAGLRARLPVVAALAGVLASGGGACAAPAPPPAEVVPEPDNLAYGAPTLSPASYTVADTATFVVDSGAMGQMSVGMAYAGTVEVDVHPGDTPDVMRARVRFQQLDGVFDVRDQPPQRVSEADIDGEFMVTIDPTGRTDIVTWPVLSQRLLDIASPESLIRPLFVQLPGRPAGPGDVWVDTIVSIEDRADGRSEVRTVITSTLVGDTAVDGRSLLLVRTHAENRLEIEGRSGGVLVRQLLAGTTRGAVIWDHDFRMIVSRQEEGHLSGTLEMPGAGVTGIPLTATVRRHVSLRGVGPPDEPSDGL